jgi:hypothetical protein
MSELTPLEETVAKLNCDDGFRCTEVCTDPVTKAFELRLERYVDGKLTPIALGCDCVVFKSPAQPNMFDQANGTRVGMLAGAMCDYINSGGHTAEVRDLLIVFARSLQQFFVEPVPEYELAELLRNDCGELERVYALPGTTGPVVRWVQGEFFDVLSAKDFAFPGSGDDAGSS